ncbi:MAG: hypothetical protein WBM99_16730 [Psychromonas sp.]
MNDYYNNSYSTFKNSETYRKLFEFLNSHDNVIRMLTATELSRPALEGVQSGLIKEFEEDIKQDNFRRWVGRMIREVMILQGYLEKPTPKKLLSNEKNIFKTGGYYQK